MGESKQLISSSSLASSACLKQSTCPYCGVGCGVDVLVDVSAKKQQLELKQLIGTPEHPANFGRLCVKGSRLLDTNAAKGRLLKPQVYGQIVDWSTAVSTVANKFKRIIHQHGPDAVAFYVSGQLLTEDYYVANKLIKGYIGSANIDTNSRLCMSSAVAAYKRAFGSDAVPCCYEDLEQTELLVLIGSNAAWTHPVLYQRMERAKQLNPAMKVVVIDPRRTASCELADLHLALKPGTDVALFNGLLRFLAEHAATDLKYIERHTENFDNTLANSQHWTLDHVSQVCDLNPSAVVTFFQLFANKSRVVSFYSMGVNQSCSGVDKANSIINCHLATGKIGKPGCGPFSITGQPNAMGGREVGGLANMLAAHMDIENPAHRHLVQEYWQSPSIAEKQGLKAVNLFEQVSSGQVKAIWIMATNPLVSMPNRNLIETALKKCELVVVSDYIAENDTLEFAHVKLPATGWSEKDGMVTNSERRMSRQRGLLPPAGEAKHDWQIICAVAKAMGYDGFDFTHPAQIFNEFAGLTAYQNAGSRDLDLSALCDLSEQKYDNLRPVQWPVNQAHPNGCKRLFSDGKFYTESGKANFVATQLNLPQQRTCVDFPFVLNSGRIRDQWHSMTRTGSTHKLTQHQAHSFVAMHPKDAAALNIKEGDLLHLSSSVSRRDKRQVILPLVIDDGMRKGELFAPIHWGLQLSSSAAIAHLYTNANDPISGQPELKHAAVAVATQPCLQHGQLFSRTELTLEWLRENLDYWTKTLIESGFLYRFALFSDKQNVPAQIRHCFPLIEEWTMQHGHSHVNAFGLRNNQLEMAIFTSVDTTNIARNWLENLFAQECLDSGHINALLNATLDTEFEKGRIICSCFGVGEKAIIESIENGCHTVSALGEALSCGTNCGSCKTELSQLIKQVRVDNSQRIHLEAV